MDLPARSEDRDSGADTSAVPPWDGLSQRYLRRVAAQRLKVLGHPDRLRIVEVLTHHPRNVGEVAAQVGLPVGTVSRHLRTMHAAGIVECSQHGNRVLYVLADREIPRLAAFAYRGAVAQARRVIALAPEPPDDDVPELESAGS